MVLDASVVIKALIGDEVGHDVARELIAEKCVVPDWLFVEVANVVATKTFYTEIEAKKMMDLVYEIGFVVEKVDRELIARAMELAKRFDVSVYDMIYAVLAQKLGIDLVTADKKFVTKTKFDFVRLLGG